MKNQFFYTRKEIKTPAEGGEPVEISYRDSINISKIIRSVEFNGALVVVLDDLHERTKEVPNIDPKNNKHLGYKKVVETFQTEVYLYGEDIERFYKLTNIE